MEEKKKFIPALISTIKYTRKVKVADIKQYLVDEYKLTNELNKENKDLRKQLEVANVISQKYDLSLITLDEYKKRLGDSKKEISDLEKTIKIKNDEIDKLTLEKNDLKIKATDISLKIDKIKKESIKEYKKELISAINDLKGNIAKTKVINLIKEIY